MALVDVQKVSKTYQVSETSVRALHEVTLSIEERRFVAFVGPSGSGKTTLLNVIGCLDRPTTGEVYIDTTRVDGFSPKEAASFRGDAIGFIFQQFNLLPVLTVYENVEYPLVMVQDTAKEDRRSRVMDLLDAVDMVDQKDKYPGQISGGQKQRTAVARALVTNPRLVLADEPTANLDQASAFRVIEAMRRMQERLGTTFVFSTHDPKVMQEAEVVFTLEDGRLVDAG
jgi:putative ABC transport system ATP-binding protein